MKRLLLIPALGLLLVFFSCSRAEPRILYVFIEKAYIWGTESPEVQYSFFILCEDDDGIENLSELHLFHDREGLRWLFTPENWVHFEEGGRDWIGSRNLAMYDGATLPRGQFRAVLVNLGGETTERNFAFDIPVISPHPFPSLSIGDGQFRIESQYPVNRLMIFDDLGNIAEVFTPAALEGRIHDWPILHNTLAAALWAEDPVYRTSAVTAAVPLW